MNGVHNDNVNIIHHSQDLETTYGASLVAQLVKNLPAVQETRFNPWVGKIGWRRKWQAILVFLPGESHGQRRLATNSPWGHKESDTTEGLTHTHTAFKRYTFEMCYKHNKTMLLTCMILVFFS